MSNDPKSKWSRRAAELPTAKADTKEMSLNERLKLVRGQGQLKTEEDGIARTRWGDTEHRPLEQHDPAPKWGAPAAPPARVGKTVLDAETNAARLAAETARQSSKDQKARVARDQQIASLVSEEDFRSILIGWTQKHGHDLYPSQFNLQNIANVLLTCLDQGNAEGVTGLNSASLETIFQWMKNQTAPPLLEPPPQLRRRGEMAARAVEYKPAQAEPEPLSQRTVQRTVVSREEVADLKSLPFEEHQRLARQGYKTRRPDNSDFKG